MQDGKHTKQFEVVSVSASSVKEADDINSSALKTFSHEILQGGYPISSNHSSSYRMTNGSASWGHGSTSLSILSSNGSLPSPGSQNPHTRSLGHLDGNSHARNDNSESFFDASKGANVSTILSTQKCCSTLQEHDYIGLSSDSSCSSAQGATITGGLSDEKCAGKNFELFTKETELRLGLGPPVTPEESGVCVDGGPLRPEGSRDRPGGSDGYFSNNVGESKNSYAEKHVEPTAMDNSLSGVSELGISFQSTAGKINPSTNNVVSRPPFTQDPSSAWTGEQHGEAYGSASTLSRAFLPQHGLASADCVSEKKLYMGQDRFGKGNLPTETKYHVMEQSRQCQGPTGQHKLFGEENHVKEGVDSNQYVDVSRQQKLQAHVTPSVHGEASAQEYRVSGPKAQTEGLDLRFPPRDLPLQSERNPCDVSFSPNFWQAHIARSYEGFRALSAKDVSQSSLSELETGKNSFGATPGGYSGSRVLTPVPRNTVPAKRGYMEAIGPIDGFNIDNRSLVADQRPNVIGTGLPLTLVGMNSGSLGVSPMDGETKFTNLQGPKHHPPVLYSWSNPIPLHAGWQLAVEQPKSVYGGVTPRGAPISQSMGQAGNAPTNETLSGVKDAHMKHSSASSRQGNHENDQGANAAEDGGGPSARAPVVGWPPIRSFRKNTLQVANSKSSAEEEEVVGASTGVTETGHAASNTLYVKANMDGVPIGRKVDLKAYDSYENLKIALEDMFKRFINGHNGVHSAYGGKDGSSSKESKQLDLFHGSDYVLTHEDKDGDWMLVGDVPWEMFVTTVRRLRIMKGSEASGLGQRVSSKLNSQGNN